MPRLTLIRSLPAIALLPLACAALRQGLDEAQGSPVIQREGGHAESYSTRDWPIFGFKQGQIRSCSIKITNIRFSKDTCLSFLFFILNTNP